MAVKPIIRVDDTRLQFWLRDEDLRQAEALRLFQDEGSALVMAEMRQRVPVRRGILRESITAYMTGDGFAVYPAAPYAPFVEKGVSPRTIFPVRARVLRFETEAGFPGRWFVRRTAEAVRERLAELLHQIFGRIYRG